jgi:predicted transcriptional regulator
MSDKKIILSTHPKHVHKIMQGLKTIELRRVFPKVDPGTVVYFYSAYPENKIIGHCSIEYTVQLSISSLWKATRFENGVNHDEFEIYFDGKNKGFAIGLSDIYSYDTPLSLEAFTFGRIKKAPISFCYIETRTAPVCIMRHVEKQKQRR